MRSFDEMNRMVQEIDRMFDQLRSTWWSEYSIPALEAGEGVGFDRETTLNLEDEGDEYVFVMDLPGFEKEDIDLTFDEGVLAVRAHRDVEEGGDGLRSVRSRHVSEHVTVPKTVVVDEIGASYRNGVLEVHLPIVEDEQNTGTSIEIE